MAMPEKNNQKTGKNTSGHKGPRTIWLEVLLFIALTVFGFSVATTLLGADVGTIFQVVPAISGTIPISVRLYESPSLRVIPPPTLSAIFRPTVQYWKDSLLQWGEQYKIDPNLIATVMQIESCGNPSARSGAGAMGLFQVMPFHFTAEEAPFEPDTNAARGIAYLAGGLEISSGHAGLALAGYNGGHSVITRSFDEWPHETQRYYRWGSGIYREASAGWESSPTLERWLAAGGRSLCASAEDYLKIKLEGDGS
jgi:hypothetical protein